MKANLEPPLLVESEADAFRFGPVDRGRLARYLELPGPEAIDPVTQEEIDRLDRMRDGLLSFWSRAVVLPIERIDRHRIELEGGVHLRSAGSYCRQLSACEADWLIVTTFTVGGLIDAKVKHHLGHGELFEAFVLNQWAAVMTEQARARQTHSLSSWVDRRGRSLLPHHGPGYNGWPLDDMPLLLRLLARPGDNGSAPGVRATGSGLLQPLHSMAIVFGATPRRMVVPRAEDLAQCHRCAMRHCRYRVAPFDPSSDPEIPGPVTALVA